MTNNRIIFCLKSYIQKWSSQEGDIYGYELFLHLTSNNTNFKSLPKLNLLKLILDEMFELLRDILLKRHNYAKIFYYNKNMRNCKR